MILIRQAQDHNGLEDTVAQFGLQVAVILSGQLRQDLQSQSMSAKGGTGHFRFLRIGGIGTVNTQATGTYGGAKVNVGLCRAAFLYSFDAVIQQVGKDAAKVAAVNRKLLGQLYCRVQTDA